MTIIEITPAQHYQAALHSVTLITTLLAKTNRTTEENKTITRNVDHLKIMVAKDYWTTENITVLQNAIAAAAVA